MKTEKKLPTRDRILLASISLFNEFGVQAVASYKIASYLGISPGNLTYYFPNKMEILRALINDLESILISHLHDFKDPRDAEEMARYFFRTFEPLWRYRFFFDSISFIIQSDEDMAARYRQLERDMHQVTVKLITSVVGEGLMRPIRPPNNVDLVADNVWAVWLHSIRAPVESTGEPAWTEREAIYNCAIHHVSLLEPYFSAGFSTKLYAALKRLRDAD